jgi:hypothetical protein
MVRRSDPERIIQARRIALRNRLIDEDRLPRALAEAWISAWEAEAARLGIAPGNEYWTYGSAWIEEQRQSGHSPETE